VLPSFAGDDWMRVALAAYRASVGAGEVDPADDALRAQLQDPPPVRCETIIAVGADDGVERTPLSIDALTRCFPGGVRVKVLAGVGHFPQREAPELVAQAVLE